VRHWLRVPTSSVSAPLALRHSLTVPANGTGSEALQRSGRARNGSGHAAVCGCHRCLASAIRRPMFSTFSSLRLSTLSFVTSLFVVVRTAVRISLLHSFSTAHLVAAFFLRFLVGFYTVSFLSTLQVESKTTSFASVDSAVLGYWRGEAWPPPASAYEASANTRHRATRVPASLCCGAPYTSWTPREPVFHRHNGRNPFSRPQPTNISMKGFLRAVGTACLLSQSANAIQVTITDPGRTPPPQERTSHADHASVGQVGGEDRGLRFNEVLHGEQHR